MPVSATPRHIPTRPSIASSVAILLRLATLFSCLASVPAAAQDRDPLVVPWAELPGVYELRDDGTLTGFFAELARAIAEEADLELRFERYGSLPEMYGALASGEAEMLAGVRRLPVLSESVAYSEQLAETAVYLFVPVEAPPDLLPETLANGRIGVIFQNAGTDLGPLGARNELVPYPDPITAFAALLVGALDGVALLHKAGADFLQLARLDDRVRIAGAPLRLDPHFVALHESRADLMPRIDAAIAALEDSGRLQEILVRWNMVRPDPIPEILTVGVAHFPPYQVVEPDGTLTGYGVETLRDLAARAGIALSFREIPIEEWTLGPGGGRYDMLPPLSVTEARRSLMQFTIPIQQSPFAIFLRSDETGAVAGLEDLAGRRVGVLERSLMLPMLDEVDGIEPVEFDDGAGLLSALLGGEVDAAAYAAIPFRHLVEDRGVEERIAEVMPPVFVSERAVALRSGLGVVRERLNAVIPGYLSSEEHSDLRDRWLGTPEVLTPERIRMLGIGAAVLIVAVLLGFLALAVRSRRQAETLAAETRMVSNRLTAILDAAKSGILGLTSDGHISVANPAARAMLGAEAAGTAFPWPAEIAFVDAEQMRPLDASRDPIRRALAGAVLRAETAIMKRAGDEEERYVHVSSAPVRSTPPSDVSTVVILDDITEEERSRQTAERAGRLDALGQLTGGVAHDFNNILATIEYSAELAALNADDKARGYLDLVRASVRRGSELTGRLLAFAKRRPGAAKSVRVADLVEEFRKLAEPLIEEQLALSFDQEEADLHVFCDPSQLENALLNLVLNSRDAILGSGTGDRITLRVRGLHDLADQDTGPQGDGADAPRFIEFAVSDNGPGMTEEVKRRATDPFFTTKAQNSGTGLGLSMVYGFAEQSGGELRIYSEPGQGTTVRILLPRGRSEGGREGPVTREAPPGGKGERVLLVEDEAELLGVISDVLRALNYEVIAESSGRAALDRVTGGLDFDLLLTDIVMPGGIGGYELARRIREIHPAIPVVYMSGYSVVTDSEMGPVVGPMVPKPCSPAELALVLRQELDPEGPG